MGIIDEQIKANNAKIEANTTKIASLKSAGDEWLSQSKVTCNYTLKSKQEDCVRDKQWKASQAQSCYDQAKILESMNAQLLADNKELIKQREAEAEAIKLLASQGTTAAAIQTKANADAEAAAAIAKANADAIATKAAADATTTTDQSKRNTMITISVVIVVLIVAGIIISKKLKKTKK